MGKLIAANLADRAAAFLSPHQLGVGCRGGCEAIHQAVREALAKHPSKAVLQLDLINAFNTVDREAALQEIAKTFPEALAWVSSCYGQPSLLLFGQFSILSETGLHQGDPLAPLIFALVLQPIVEMIQQLSPDLNAWFLDDGTLVADEEVLQESVDTILREGPAKGLILSTTATSPQPKSSVWKQPSEQDREVRLTGVPTNTDDGITVLGAPIGSPEFVKEALLAKVEKVKLITALLPTLEDPHLEFILLRSCLALPKIAFQLRTVDTTPFSDILESFDSTVREALTRILGSPVNNQQWLQARLPVHIGGLGLRGAAEHASASHVASLLASETQVRRLLQSPEDDTARFTLPQPLLDDLAARQGEEASVETVWGLTQKMLSKRIDSQNLQRLRDQVGDDDVREKAKLESLGLPYAGAWLVAPPIRALGLHLQPAEFIMAVKLRLGIHVYTSDSPCPACQRPSCRHGDHALCCSHWGERITRHNLLRDHIHDMAAAACLGPVKEGRYLLPGANRRPADVLIHSWDSGCDAALDLTVVHPLQADFVAGAAANPGFALSQAFDRKMRSAADDCRAQGISFLPMAVESLGGWHEVAVNQVKKLASALARQEGRQEGEVVAHAFQRLAIILQKGNAKILLNRIPHSTGGPVDGDYD